MHLIIIPCKQLPPFLSIHFSLLKSTLGGALLKCFVHGILIELIFFFLLDLEERGYHFTIFGLNVMYLKVFKVL